MQEYVIDISHGQLSAQLQHLIEGGGSISVTDPDKNTGLG